MTKFARLEDAVMDDAFPDVDLALRKGCHIDQDDLAFYGFLVDAEDQLSPWYRRFGCELVHRTDGYFYLLPTSDRLGRRHLSAAEMLVGQALTLLYLDPVTTQQGGIVTREQLLSTLAGVMGADSLIRMLNPKKKRLDERVAQETVRSKVAEALRRLSGLGFLDLVEENKIRLRRALLRFAEPVRGVAAPEAELERLLAEGELILTDTEAGDGPEEHDGEFSTGEAEGHDEEPAAAEAEGHDEEPAAAETEASDAREIARPGSTERARESDRAASDEGASRSVHSVGADDPGASHGQPSKSEIHGEEPE